MTFYRLIDNDHGYSQRSRRWECASESNVVEESKRVKESSKNVHWRELAGHDKQRRAKSGEMSICCTLCGENLDLFKAKRNRYLTIIYDTHYFYFTIKRNLVLF